MSSVEIVKLNVGGTIFETSKSTLTKFDGFFKTLLETGVPIAKDERGAIFIDRSPDQFKLILQYMRDGHVTLPKSSEAVDEIQEEAQYYLLDGLVELCKSQGTGGFVIRHLETWQEEMTAIVNSRKKAVIIIEYQENCSPNSDKITKILLKYGKFVDVFFRVVSSVYSPSQCTVHDKIKKKYFTCAIRELDGKLTSECAHLLLFLSE